MTLKEKRKLFHTENGAALPGLLTFRGIEKQDVYNCSAPFIHDGKEYIFGRVEMRADYANSTTWLFEKTGENEYSVVPGSVVYPIEDPFVQIINGEIVLGGTHVRKTKGRIDEYRVYFYRGTDPRMLSHFTCGPSMMKDVRLVGLENGAVGVFSRQRHSERTARYNTSTVIGYAEIPSLDELDADVIDNAPIIENLFQKDEWGGCNQCHLLKDGRIGIIGHGSYGETDADGIEQLVYLNIAFIFDPKTFKATEIKIIGDKPSYPVVGSKKPNLKDCAFTSGIVMLADGKVKLYSGLGDIAEGVITIDAPF